MQSASWGNIRTFAPEVLLCPCKSLFTSLHHRDLSDRVCYADQRRRLYRSRDQTSLSSTGSKIRLSKLIVATMAELLVTPTSDFVLTLRACRSLRWEGPDAEVLHLTAFHLGIGLCNWPWQNAVNMCLLISASEDSFRQPEKDLPASHCSLEYIQKRNKSDLDSLARDQAAT